MNDAATRHDDGPRAYTLTEASRRLAISKRCAYDLISRGELRAVKIGRVYRVTETELRRILDEPLATETP